MECGTDAIKLGENVLQAGIEALLVLLSVVKRSEAVRERWKVGAERRREVSERVCWG